MHRKKNSKPEPPPMEVLPTATSDTARLFISNHPLLAKLSPFAVGAGAFWGATTMIQIGEFGLAFVFLVVSATLVTLGVLWSGFQSRRATIVYRSIALAVVATAFVFWCADFYKIKRDQPWSHLSDRVVNAPITAQQPSESLGVRIVGMEVTPPPRVGEPIEIAAEWENQSDENLIVRDRYVISTIGLSDAESGPFRIPTEERIEAQMYQRLANVRRDNLHEVEPHAKFLVRYRTDAKSPVDEFLAAEIKKGRARVYLIGDAVWRSTGSEHGLEFCSWTIADGHIYYCHHHNRAW